MRGYLVIALAGLVLAGCSERNVLGPEALEPSPIPTDAGLRRMVCEANVKTATVICSEVGPQTPGGISPDRIIGGQDIYVRLSSSNTSYDAGTEIFSTNVTVQNLIDYAIGTDDGVTVTGVSVFFHDGPTANSGTGTVSIANPTGTGTFTSADQPYYRYNQILTPLEISSSINWQFHVPSTVNSFVFTVFVSAPMQNEALPMHEMVWTGTVSGQWSAGENWLKGSAPDSGSSAMVKPASMWDGEMPTLESDVDVMNLRIGQGSSMNLAGFTATVGGNLDAVGTMSGGTARLTGSGALLRGNVDALQIEGSAKLQGATRTTGAVSISGSLTTNGNTLTIIIP